MMRDCHQEVTLQPTQNRQLEATQAKSLRIALLEDEPFIAMLLEDLLTDMGHSICASEATQERAVAKFRGENPDIMIADCHLRQGNGIDAVAEILKGGFVPHIFMTGDDLSAKRHLFHPAAVLLRKPFLDEDLTLAIKEALSKQA